MFEIPLFYFSKQVLTFFGSKSLLLIACVAYSSRVFAYTIMSNPWQVMLVEPLHGVTYACSQLAAVDFAANLKYNGKNNEKFVASVQGLRGAVSSLGYAIGTLFGGFVLQDYSSIVMYRGSSLMVMLAMMLFLYVSIQQGTIQLNVNCLRLIFRRNSSSGMVVADNADATEDSNLNSLSST